MVIIKSIQRDGSSYAVDVSDENYYVLIKDGIILCRGESWGDLEMCDKVSRIIVQELMKS